jgi:hypothetical protein
MVPDIFARLYLLPGETSCFRILSYGVGNWIGIMTKGLEAIFICICSSVCVTSKTIDKMAIGKVTGFCIIVSFPKIFVWACLLWLSVTRHFRQFGEYEQR